MATNHFCVTLTGEPAAKLLTAIQQESQDSFHLLPVDQAETDRFIVMVDGQETHHTIVLRPTGVWVIESMLDVVVR